MTEFFGGDILPFDVVLRIPNHSKFKAFVEANVSDVLDGKTRVSSEQSKVIGRELFHDEEYSRPTQRCVDLLEGNQLVRGPGGSSATTLIKAVESCSTLSALFLGITGDDALGERIREAFRDAKMLLLPQYFRSGIQPETAVSFSFQNTDVNSKEFTAYAVNRGNARDIIRPEIITPALIDRADAIFWQASMMEKFDPTVSHRILDYGKGKKWHLAPHTGETSARASNGEFQRLLPDAYRLYGSIREWSWTLLPHVATDDIRPEPVLKSLQTLFKRCATGQAASLTHGEHGVFIVTADGYDHAPVMQVKEMKGAGGAGDNAAAGEIVADEMGLTPRLGGIIGQGFAAVKIEATAGPRAPGNMLVQTFERYPEIAAMYDREVVGQLARHGAVFSGRGLSGAEVAHM